MAETYQLWKSMMIANEEVSFFQEFFVKFYQAFIEKDRWVQYLDGIGTTLLVTAIALGIGVVLGVLVAVVRTAHDQQRPGKKNFLLGLINAVCQVYVTVINPM